MMINNRRKVKAKEAKLAVEERVSLPYITAKYLIETLSSCIRQLAQDRHHVLGVHPFD